MLSYGTNDVKDQVDRSRMGANIGGSSYKERVSSRKATYDIIHHTNRIAHVLVITLLSRRPLSRASPSFLSTSSCSF
jgi:hypothetical protein